MTRYRLATTKCRSCNADIGFVGWVCPRCQRVHAPTVTTCLCDSLAVTAATSVRRSADAEGSRGKRGKTNAPDGAGGSR